MAVISKDLGAVTAYAAAVNRGYTGTKEEFETLMASYATVAQQAAESAQSAEQSAQSASGSATDAQTAQGTAQQAATDAQTAQASAQGYAQSAQQSAQSASQYAQNAESAKDTAVDAVDGFASGAQQALESVNSAGINWKSLAEAQKLDSEAWAVGKRGGEDVGSSDPAYHNNAKYYAESVSASAQTATDAAQTATQKASEAQASASAAAESARTLTIDATLTQSGQAADSKAVGDAFDTIKDNIGIKTVAFEEVVGKYITHNSTEGSSSAFNRSTPVAVRKGEIVNFIATGYTTNVAMIATSNEDATSFQLKVRSIDNSQHNYTYTVEEDGYIVVSYNKNASKLLIVKSAELSNDGLKSRLDDLKEDDVKSLVADSGITIIADEVLMEIGQAGKYVNKNSTISTSANFNISEPIALTKGSTLVFNAKGYLDQVALLAKVTGSNTYEMLMQSADNDEHVFTYSVNEDMSAVISSIKTATVKYSIFTSRIDSQDARIFELEKKDYFAFATMGVIGDSLASGASNFSSGASDRPVYSWGKYIEREHGVDVHLFSKGGATTRLWLIGEWGLAALQSASVLDLYVIGLGVNDAYSLGSDYLGTVNDVHVGSESQNADTYYGNYSKIIGAIKAKSPRAKIICLTNPKGTTETGIAYNQAVRDIAGLYSNTYVIDLASDNFYASPDFNAAWISAHSTALGYKMIAENIYKHISELVRTHMAEFTDIQWIAEDHP